MKSAAHGRALANELIARLRAYARPATLAILATDDEDGRRFVRIKQQALADVALTIIPIWLAPTATTADALAAINRLNDRIDVDGIFLQFPLPPNVEAQVAADAVQVSKDIDCSGSAAEREFLEGRSAFVPVAPRAALQLLRHELGTLNGKQVVLAAADDPFVRALRKLLEDAGGNATTSGEGAIDALVITETLPPPAVLENFPRIQVLLDAGYYLPRRPANWILPAARERIGVHLTQYGNVGPLTVAYLAQATLHAAEQAATT